MIKAKILVDKSSSITAENKLLFYVYYNMATKGVNKDPKPAESTTSTKEQ